MQPEALPGCTEKSVVPLNDLVLPRILKVAIKQEHPSIWTRQWDTGHKGLQHQPCSFQPSAAQGWESGGLSPNDQILPFPCSSKAQTCW